MASLKDLLPGVQENVPLSNYTTFRIGGAAKYFFICEDKNSILNAVRAAKECSLPVFVLGGGSNILVSEEGFNGLVLKLALRGIEQAVDGQEVYVSVGAGEVWDSFVEQMVQKGYWGLENLSGIPGTVGAAPIQNIGAYGTEIKDTLLSLEALNMDTLEFERLYNKDCDFAYRESIFKKPEGSRFIITDVSFRLQKNGTPRTHYYDVGRYLEEHALEHPTIADMRRLILEIRSQKFPDITKVGTAGSFFKNPIVSGKELERLRSRFPDIPSYDADGGNRKIALAWILDKVCNVKGVRRGDVGLFERQPLVLVNYGNANANEVKEFANEVVSQVKGETGLLVEFEVQSV